MIGESLGPYKILEPLGAGGMGEVYLGEDTRLGRKVAIKVLPAEFASDPERLARFEQEARAAAALNHPHIAVLHDIGYEDRGTVVEARTDPDMEVDSMPVTGVHYMVQEYLEGETLRAPLKKGALAVRKSLDLGTEIAEALTVAHSAGIVHRDLKPENVFITKEGHAKVLDFGLAKLVEMAPAMSPGGEASKSPTMLGTIAGQVMGTAGYMAPEQVQGDGDIDHRADVFAFGCLLYELLTGRQAFAGRNVLDTLGRIVDQEPDSMSTIDPGLPAEAERIVRKCLAKEPAKRYQTAGDLVVDLQALVSDVETGVALPVPGAVAPEAVVGAPTVSPWKLAGPLAAAALLAGIGIGWVATRPVPPEPEPPKIFSFEAFGELPSHAAAVSPDGETIAFATEGTEGGPLGLRRLDQLEYEVLSNTGRALYPFFSPDGLWVGYWSLSGRLMKVALAGGDPFELCAAVGAHGWWNEDDTIYFTDRNTGVLLSVPGVGGEPTMVAEPEEGFGYHRPQVLPGNRYALVERKGVEGSNVGAVSLAEGSYTQILDQGADPRYLDSGHLVFGRGDTIWAVAFDAETLQTTGQPSPIVRGVEGGRPGTDIKFGGMSNFSVGPNGTLVYVPGIVGGQGAGQPTRLIWLDRRGIIDPLPITGGSFRQPRLSPDGQQVAVVRRSEDGADIYVYDIDGGAGRRLSLEGFDEDPVWTADGEWILFTSDRAGSADIYRKRADGTTDVAEEVIVGELDVFGASVSPDGTEVFYTLDTGDQDDVFKAFVDGGGPEPILASAFAEREARLSPDGTLLAYVTDRTGSPEVYVLDVATGRPVPVSIGGGYDPVWATDGSELYFMQQGGRIMAAALDETATDLGFTTPQALFELPPNVLATFDPAGDGRFLAVERIINPSGDPDDEQPAGGPQIHVVLNWIEELKERVPTGR